MERLLLPWANHVRQHSLYPPNLPKSSCALCPVVFVPSEDCARDAARLALSAPAKPTCPRVHDLIPGGEQILSTAAVSSFHSPSQDPIFVHICAYTTHSLHTHIRFQARFRFTSKVFRSIHPTPSRETLILHRNRTTSDILRHLSPRSHLGARLGRLVCPVLTTSHLQKKRLANPLSVLEHYTLPTYPHHCRDPLFRGFSFPHFSAHLRGGQRLPKSRGLAWPPIYQQYNQGVSGLLIGIAGLWQKREEIRSLVYEVSVLSQVPRFPSKSSRPVVWISPCIVKGPKHKRSNHGFAP